MEWDQTIVMLGIPLLICPSREEQLHNVAVVLEGGYGRVVTGSLVGQRTRSHWPFLPNISLTLLQRAPYVHRVVSMLAYRLLDVHECLRSHEELNA